MMPLIRPPKFVHYRSMDAHPPLAKVAALIGDPVRALMLSALMDGRSRTAGELAQVGGITPQTASAHLARLVDAGLLATEKQGRHRYHRLASSEVSHALEALMTIATAPAKLPLLGPRDQALRYARTCYDHMAGELAVQLADRWIATGWIDRHDQTWSVTAKGQQGLEELGITLPQAVPRRPVVRSCLDWSERRHHIAGQLGACLLSTLLARRWARRISNSRALTLSDEGDRALRRWSGIAP